MSINPFLKSGRDCVRLSLGYMAALVLLAVPAAVSAVEVLQGNIPAATAHLTPTGVLPASQKLNLAIGLPITDGEGLTNLLREIYDPNSPQYHQFLTPQQFTDRFGPSVQDYQALIDWAKANKLEVTTRHPNRIVLDVRGSVDDIQNALHLTMRTYNHPKDGRTFYAPSAAPQLDIGIPVLHISGLDNYTLPYPKLRRASDNTSTNIVPHSGSGPGGNYMGYDFRNAYVPGTTLTGAGQSIGLLEFDGYFPSDVAQYLAQAGLPSVPLVNVAIDGFTGPPGPGNGEVTLDIDMAIAMAPGLSSIIVYSAPNPSPWVDLLSRMASDNLAKQLSCSWGGGPPDPTGEQIFLQMAAQGQSFFDAVGDSDAFVGGDIPFPGDSPNITQVGGTTLNTSGPLGSYLSEKVWNWGGGEGTCGGISTNFAIPTWQLGISMTTNQGSATMRNLPDVALTADNIYIVADNGIPEPGTGGTSAAAPLWAGFIALVNQQAQQGGLPPVGFLNPTVYGICKSPLYGSTFHDVVTGDNTSPASPTLFSAVPGYDLCTGWGSPSGTNLINILAPAAPNAFLVVVTNTVFGGNNNGVVDTNECDNFNVILANFGSSTATFVRGTLSTTTPGVFIAQPFASYPDIPPGGFATNTPAFKISTTPTFVCGTPIDLTLVAKCTQSSDTNQFRILTGMPTTNIFRFDNSSPAAIPDLGETNSPIVVSNVNAALNKVVVSMFITHTFDSDLLLELISPDGTTNILSANNGAGGDNYGTSCGFDSLRTTFDDAGTNSITAGFPPFVGTFQPETPLSIFIGKSGTNVNGTWRLRAVDQAFFDVGTIQCWSLFLTPAACTDGGGECPGSDLALGITAQPSPVIIGQNLTYTISVTNNGPSTAKNVTISHQLPGSVLFISASASQGTTAQASGLVIGNLGTLAVGASATMTVTVIPTVQGGITSTATVTSSQTDPDPSNNSATVTVIVNPTTADLAVGLFAAPNPGVLGQTLTYTISITNNGPSDASGVTVTNNLPANALVVSTSASQGSTTPDGSLWTVGTLFAGGRATATIIVAPTVEGTLSATSTVQGNQFDSNPANNVATLNVPVGPSTDLAIGIADFPDPAVVSSNVTYVVSVTNLGPSQATGISVSQFLPVGVPVLSTNASLGTVSIANNALAWALGSLASGAKATLTIVVGSVTNGVLNTSATVSGDQPDPNTANNSASASTVVAPPGTAIAAAGATLTAESFSPPNGAIDIGETVTIILRLRNSSNVSTLNLVGTLQTNANVTPSVPNNPQSYGVLAPSGLAVGRPFTFTATGTNGETITATLALRDGTTTYPPVTFNFTLPSTRTFSSADFIAIRDGTNGLPYPSTILVSGFDGTVGKVTATVSNLTHTFAPDIDILLASPIALKTMLMSAAGGNSGIANATITFDDAAPSPVPVDSPLSPGTFQPANYLGNNLPNPAPAGPYTAALSTFNGANPNGLWSLYVNDHTLGDTGSIAGGWSLTFTTISPVNQLADLVLSGVGSPNPVTANSLLTYTFTVLNLGPSPATSVAFTNILPAGVTLYSASCSQGTVITNGTTVLASLGNISTGAVATVTIGVVPSLALISQGFNSASLTNTANVASGETDSNPANNIASVITTVQRPVVDVVVGSVLTPVAAATTLPLTNSIAVTNRGPGTALGVVVTNPLPAGAAFVSAVSSVGTCTNLSGVVTCFLGDMAPNANATVTIVITPSIAGLMTNIVAAVTGSQDTNTANNVVTNIIAIVNPSAQIINAGAALTYESGPVNGLIDPGETVTVSFSLANVGTLDTVNLKATLQATGGVLSPSGTQSYGALVHQGPSSSRSFTFTSGASAGAPVVATLQLKDERPGITNTLSPVTFTFNPPVQTHMAGTNAIIIPDHGVGTPYPSVINVSGLDGVVTKATVTLKNLTHTFPRDVNVLLTSPAGAKVVLMAHTGGGRSVTNVTLTFDDASTILLSNGGPLTNGTSKPTSYPAVPAFPAPAPAAPYGTALGGVSGSSANGAWSLYVFDDSVGDSGVISGGWTLDLSTATLLRPLADMAISMSSAPTSVTVGGTVTNTIWVTNLGPSSATGIIVTNTLSSGEQVVTNVGSLAANAAMKVTLVLAPSVGGSVIDTATVGANEADLNPANNIAQTTISVTAPTTAILEALMISNKLNLSIIAQPGYTYAILASTNTSTWLPISTNTVPLSGVIKFTDTNSPSYNTRYYRTKLLSP